jgi:hypothetical protein
MHKIESSNFLVITQCSLPVLGDDTPLQMVTPMLRTGIFSTRGLFIQLQIGWEQLTYNEAASSTDQAPRIVNYFIK